VLSPSSRIVCCGSYHHDKEKCFLHCSSLEPVVGRVLVDYIILEDVISIHRKSACYPYVDLLIPDSLLRQVDVDVLLRWNLVGSLFGHTVVVFIMVVAVTMSS
jgi:hypothetical protein